MKYEIRLSPGCYRDKAPDEGLSTGFKYPVMNVLNICRHPGRELAADNYLLAMGTNSATRDAKGCRSMGIPPNDDEGIRMEQMGWRTEDQIGNGHETPHPGGQ